MLQSIKIIKLGDQISGAIYNYFLLIRNIWLKVLIIPEGKQQKKKTGKKEKTTKSENSFVVVSLRRSLSLFCPYNGAAEE